MKLKDILTTEVWNKYGDMDVVNDVIDDYFPAWCGNTLTAEGLEHYKEALELEADIWGDETYAQIHVRVDSPDEKTWKRNYRMARDLFSDMCGYCTEEEYNRWFKED